MKILQQVLLLARGQISSSKMWKTFKFSAFLRIAKLTLPLQQSLNCGYSLFLKLSDSNFGKMGFQPTFFPLHPQLFEVECQREEKHLCPHIRFTFGEKSTESKIIFEQRKCPLHLNGAAHPQIDSSVACNVCLRFISLFPESLFQHDFLRLVGFLCLTASTASGAVLAAFTAVMCRGDKMSV